MPLINGVTLLLTFLSNIFFLVGCIGFSSDKNTIKNVSWFYYKDDSNAWFGLQKFYVDIDLAPYLVMKETVAYSSDSCGGTYCDECDRDGKGAFGLLIIALIFTVFSLLLNGASTASPSAPVQMGNAFTALVAFVASLVSISLFMGDCYRLVTDGGSSNVYWGPGSVLTITAMLFMFIVAILKVAAALCGCCAAVKGGDGGLTANANV